MKKILAVVGSCTLASSSLVPVIAYANSNILAQKDDIWNYDNNLEVQEITTNAVDRMKSIVLADQFQLSDDVHWERIVDYNKNSRFKTLFDNDSVKSSEKKGLDLTGTRGVGNDLAKELLQLILDQIENNDIPFGLADQLKDIIEDLNLPDLIEKNGELITMLPKNITAMSVEQLVSAIPVIIKFLSGPILSLIGGINDNILNIIAEGVAATLKSTLKNLGINDLISTLVHESDVETYKDLTFNQISRRMWMSLLTTIGYATNPNYVSNPEKELDPENVSRLAAKFTDNLSGASISPNTGEEVETFGVLKYAVSTIKMFEIYFQFFGEELFTEVPDVNDWTSETGNTHLFSKTQTNSEYFKSLANVKVETLTQIRPGINLSFFWKILKTFLANPADKESGPMFQKFLNALLTDYDLKKTEKDFIIPVVKEILLFSPLIPGIGRALLNNVFWQIEGIFTNKIIPVSFEGLLGTIVGFLPAGTESVRDIITNLVNFLRSSTGTIFKNKAFDYLWNDEVSLIIPTLLPELKTKLKVETLSLKSLIYEAEVIDIFSLVNVDISKYGTRYTANSIAELIRKLDQFMEVDKISYVDLNKENLDLTKIAAIIDILVNENTIKLTAQEDKAKDPVTDHSLVRQLISNIKNPEIIQKILGIEFNEENKIEVVKNSLIGLIINFILPNTPISSETNYTNEDLVNADGFNRKLIQALGDLITSILEDTDYTYLIEPLVLDVEDKIWKLLNIRSVYFKNSNGKLLYQKIVLAFDPTGVVLKDGSIVKPGHQAIYEIIFLRNDPEGKFFFEQISKEETISNINF